MHYRCKPSRQKQKKVHVVRRTLVCHSQQMCYRHNNNWYWPSQVKSKTHPNQVVEQDSPDINICCCCCLWLMFFLVFSLLFNEFVFCFQRCILLCQFAATQSPSCQYSKRRRESRESICYVLEGSSIFKWTAACEVAISFAQPHMLFELLFW